MRFQITVEVDAASRDAARRMFTDAGHVVTRATVVKATASSTTTTPNPFVRASALIDMPDGLDRESQRAYVRGYARGCTAFVRKHGAPTHVGPVIGASDVEQLGRATREHEWERHPSCHKAAMAELNRHHARVEPERVAA